MPAVIYCDRPSNAALLLARTLGIPKVRDNVKGWRAVRDASLVINYGTGHTPEFGFTDNPWLNQIENVRVAMCKVQTSIDLEAAGVPVVEAYLQESTARQWEAEGHKVLTRRDGLSGGRGIIVGVVPRQAGWYYSKYFPKTHEYRVHVAGGNVIHVQQKKAVAGVEVNRLIRTHKNGWVFAEHDFTILEPDLETIKTASITACNALGLDFGAVDVLVRLRKREPRRLLQFAICEVNTAPGLESTNTLNAYVHYFRTVTGE